MATLEDTLALVEAQTTRVDSLIALTDDLHQRVLGALGGGLTPSQQMRVDAVFDEVTKEAAKVDAAITANTPQATAGAVSGGQSFGKIKANAQGFSNAQGPNGDPNRPLASADTINPNVSIDPSKPGDPNLIAGVNPGVASS